MAAGKEAKVGLVFFLGLLLLFALTVIIGRGELGIHRGYYHIDVIFDNIQGLRQNDIVELSGMEVGRVHSISLEEDKICVRLRIDSSVKIRKDSTFTIADKSLIGGKVVSVTMGTPGEPALGPGSKIRGETAPTPLELIKQAGGFAEHIEKTLAEAETVLPELKSLIASLNRIASGIEEGRGTMGRLITEDELYEDVSETVKSARRSAGELEEFTERMDRLKTYLGAESSYNENTSRLLTKVYVRIEPRPEKFYLLGGSILTGEGTEWDEKDTGPVELDLQIGRRWLDGRLAGGAGLYESRPGAGVVYSFNDRVSAGLEGRSVWTREKDEGISPFLLRGRINFELLRGVSLHAGVDNILDEPGFNAGIRLEYSDEDIKYLLSILSLGR